MQGVYKVSEAIQVTYQAINAVSALTTLVMEIYDETGAKDVGNFPDVVMAEVGSSGRYTGTFTPDAEGVWIIQIENTADGSGKVVRQFEVGAENVASIGGKIDALNNLSQGEALVAADAALSAYDVPTKGELDTTESNIRGTDNDTLKTISDQIDGMSYGQPMLG